MMVLFESHDNDFSECLLIVVEWFTRRAYGGLTESLRAWLLSDDAVATLSEAFAAEAYARDCSDVALDVDDDGVRRGSPRATLGDRRQYLGKLKISIVEVLPEDYDGNGESVLWDGDKLEII